MGLADLIGAYRPDAPTVRRPAIIAEAGVNHEGSMDIARRLIEEAAEGGADAIKFQTYKAETIAARNSPAYWDTTKEATTSQFELFKKYDTFWKDEFAALREHCDRTGIEFLSTPFDIESAVFLADLQDVVKISSSDLTNLPFIEFLCTFGKPVLLSTGASNLWEISEAVETIGRAGNPLALMHCILNYPTDTRNANLGMLLDQRRRFPEALPGYSDHTVPDEEKSVLTTAMLLGAQVIEKHFTHDKTLPGNDHYHAMDLADLRDIRRRIDDVLTIVGDQHKHALDSELPARANARRSLVAARTIEAGATIAAADLTWKRPAHGISPRDYRTVVGKRARDEIPEDELLQWWMLD
jgi:N-acetylneuraminate synthase